MVLTSKIRRSRGNWVTGTLSQWVRGWAQPAAGWDLSPTFSRQPLPNSADYEEPGETHSSVNKLREVAGSKKEDGFRQSRGLRQCRTHLGVVNGTLRLELEHRDTAIGSAPCYLYDSGLELPAPQFLHLSIPHDCPYLSPSIAVRIGRHRIGSSVQTGKRGKSKGLLL